MGGWPGVEREAAGDGDVLVVSDPAPEPERLSVRHLRALPSQPAAASGAGHGNASAFHAAMLSVATYKSLAQFFNSQLCHCTVNDGVEVRRDGARRSRRELGAVVYAK